MFLDPVKRSYFIKTCNMVVVFVSKQDSRKSFDFLALSICCRKSGPASITSVNPSIPTSIEALNLLSFSSEERQTSQLHATTGTP